MFSPSRKVRASLRRTLWLILIGFFTGAIMVETMVEYSLQTASYSPTRSAGLMLNRSQMVLSKDIVLEPTLYTCQSKLTGKSTYPVFIIVKTRAVGQGEFFQRRMFTRTSWAREAQAVGIPVIYAVGRPEDSKTQSMLENENKQFGDILQFNYIDAYYNITIKSTGILHWFSTRACHMLTRYVFIVDDDVLINIPVFLRMINRGDFHANTIYGLYLADIEPHPSGKWAVSLTDFPNRTYPAFITGASTLYPSDVISRLVETIFQMVQRDQPIFFLDDVLITGVVAEQLGIVRAPMPGIEDCSYTDLFSRTIIGECSNLRRVYVWSKFLLKRLGEATFHIDRLIEKTIYLKWRGDFKHMRNGTAIITSNRFDRSIRTILFYYHSNLTHIIIFTLLILFIFIFIPKFLGYGQPPLKSPINPSIPSNSSMLLAPVKKVENKH